MRMDRLKRAPFGAAMLAAVALVIGGMAGLPPAQPAPRAGCLDDAGHARTCTVCTSLNRLPVPPVARLALRSPESED